MTEDTLHYDAVVVGGGLVGQLLALVLAKENNTVAMIEQRALPSKYTDDFDNRGIALAYPSLCMLNTLGLWQKLSSYATAIHRVHVSNKGSLPQVNLNREGLPGLGAVVETPHLLTVLSEAVSKSKIEVIAPAEVLGLEDHGYGKKLRIKKDGLENDIVAKLLCACDGAQSMIRGELDISTEHTDYKQSALTFNVGLKRGHHNIAYERFINNGVMAMLPITQDRSACVWTMSPSDAEQNIKLSDAELLKQVQATFGYRLGRFTQLGKRHVFPLHLIRAKQLYKENVLLFGNAAHFLHPISGQGFNLSFRDVGIFADLLNTHGLKNYNTTLLEQFESLRIKDHRRTIKVTDGLVQTFLSENKLIQAGRSLSMSVLERSSLGKKMVNQVMMGKLDPMSSLTNSKIVE